jgi:hypothetical protein
MLELKESKTHRRGAEDAEGAQRKTIPDLKFEISNLKAQASASLCVLCASAVNAPRVILKIE